MNAFSQSLLVAAGAAVGANARYWIGVAAKASTQIWPWPTLLINFLGSIALGVFAALALAKGWSDGWKLLIAVGFCGGFTTFSTFSFEVVDLFLRKEPATAIQYIAASVVLCIAGCWAGVHLARR